MPQIRKESVIRVFGHLLFPTKQGRVEVFLSRLAFGRIHLPTILTKSFENLFPLFLWRLCAKPFCSYPWFYARNSSERYFFLLNAYLYLWLSTWEIVGQLVIMRENWRWSHFSNKKDVVVTGSLLRTKPQDKVVSEGDPENRFPNFPANWPCAYAHVLLVFVSSPRNFLFFIRLLFHFHTHLGPADAR